MKQKQQTIIVGNSFKKLYQKLVLWVPNTSKRPRAFICFSVFGTPNETLALVFDILQKKCSICIETKVTLRLDKNIFLKFK